MGVERSNALRLGKYGFKRMEKLGKSISNKTPKYGLYEEMQLSTGQSYAISFAIGDTVTNETPCCKMNC